MVCFKGDKMRGFVWFALAVLLFLAWGISYMVFHVAGLLIHLLLVLALISLVLHVHRKTHRSAPITTSPVSYWMDKKRACMVLYCTLFSHKGAFAWTSGIG